jgi:hypothetical protein
MKEEDFSSLDFFYDARYVLIGVLTFILIPVCYKTFKPTVAIDPTTLARIAKLTCSIGVCLGFLLSKRAIEFFGLLLWSVGYGIDTILVSSANILDSSFSNWLILVTICLVALIDIINDRKRKYGNPPDQIESTISISTIWTAMVCIVLRNLIFH